MENPSLVFYEVVAQLLPLLFITLLIERAFPVQTTEGNKEDGLMAESDLQRSIDIVSMWSTALLVVTVVLGEAMTLRILFRQEATKAQQIVVIVALFFAGGSLAAPILFNLLNDFVTFIPKKVQPIALLAGTMILSFGLWALVLYISGSGGRP